MRLRKLFVGAIAIASMIFGCLTAAQAQSVAGASRPASVPAGYIITPFGYFHPSCVQRMRMGDALRSADKVVRHADGSSTAMTVCAYAHYRADGESVFGDEKAVTNPNISHAYVEYVTVTSPTAYGYLNAEWTVPPAPASDNGQTLYLFPGLEDINDVVTIIQPVLGWNSDYASAWGIASWNCCENGTVYEAAPTPVKSGDTILGYMYNSCPPGTLTCGSWDVVTKDLRTGKTSELLNTSNFGQTFNWAFGAALEVYGIKTCSDYPLVSGAPGSSAISFNKLGLYTYKLHEVANPAWKVSITSGLTPQCNYAGTLPKQIILNY
jgi:hypothetical protein